jgi:biotin transport system substrate-specific component
MNQNSSLEGTLVSKALQMPLAPVAATAAPVSAESSLLRQAGIVLAGSALVAVSAHIALPLYFTPVPLTLQTLAVLLLGLVLSPRLAAATLGAYLIEGALGLPVFAPSTLALTGIAHLFGPTGGYLLAYPLAAAVASFLWRRTGSPARRGFTTALLSATAASLPILAFGAIWLGVFSHASLQNVLSLAVLPVSTRRRAQNHRRSRHGSRIHAPVPQNFIANSSKHDRLFPEQCFPERTLT